MALEEIKDPSKWPAKGAFKDSVDPSIKPPKQVKHDEYDPEKEQLVKKKSNKRKNEVTLRDQMFTLRVKLQEFLQSDV